MSACVARFLHFRETKASERIPRGALDVEGVTLRVAIMQPYLLPYQGYFQLIEYVDRFVVYDDIEYTKKGWINRNRILRNGEPAYFTLPIKSDRDTMDVRDRSIADAFDKGKLQRQILQPYARAPHLDEMSSLVRDVLSFNGTNLFAFVWNSLQLATAVLGIETEFVVSSSLGISRSLRGEDRVIETCSALGATEYVNPIGGLDLYDAERFADRGIDLRFHRAQLSPYQQSSQEFVAGLSVIDSIAFLGASEAARFIRSDFEILTKPAVQRERL